MIQPRRRSQSEDAAADLARREDPYNVTQASRIYFLPNLMTAGNLFCGFMAIVECIQARLAETSLNSEYPRRDERGTLQICRLADLWSGSFRHARWPFGPDGRPRVPLWSGVRFVGRRHFLRHGACTLDVLSDHLANPGQSSGFRHVGWFIGFVYLLCAAIRLARFNVITNPLLYRGKKESNKDFVGLPVPAAASTVASLVLFSAQTGRDRPLA